ncbi:hypothetical protein CP533_0762 [Ophiocordyceps camponoti-saundersi (nom. inval.)]|nr:hypothetical protein CP533_0762 [Ophiocordyceps camponoti-saundersi (nom. inval.)]
MAIDFIMPTPRADPSQQSWRVLPPQPQQQPQPQPTREDRSHPFFRTSAGPQISPQSISDASSNQTNYSSYPPSPTTATVLTTHQGRPLYIPAVLRPCDEFPSRKIHGNNAANSASVSDSDSDSPLRRVNSNIINLAALGHRLTRRTSSTDCAKAFEGEWNLDSYPEVTDLPTRIHWKPDQQSSVCDDPTCKRGFSYFVRRHHCRKCGNIFCDWHSSFFLPLDQDATFNPRASLSRACNHCFQEAKAASHARNEASGPNAAALSSSSPPTNSSAPTPMNARSSTMTLPCAADVAASVPRDWNWSTF